MATPPDFSVGQVLTAAHMDAVGLWLVKTVTVSNAATLDVESCFTNDYENYRVLVNLTSNHSTNTFVRLRMFSGTNTPETGNVYDRFGFYWTTTAVNAVFANDTGLVLGDIVNISANRFVSSFDIFNPNEATHTNIMPYTWGSATGSVFLQPCRIETTTAYTGIRFFADAGNISGTARVYGYRD